MACKQMLAVLVVAAVSMAVLPAMVRATEYMVGDDKGWNRGVNYTEWVQDKVFVVGDSLVFMYARGKHNVLKVSGSDFKTCNASALGAPLESGNDTIPLSSPGRKWYICGKPGHCADGQKLVISVSEAPAPSPIPAAPSPIPAAPSPTSSSNKIMVPGCKSLMVAAVAGVLMMTFII